MTYKEYGKDFQKRSDIERYCEPFIYADSFRDDKRFARYVSKIKSACDKTIREQFFEPGETVSDAYQFIMDIIKEEANLWYMKSEEIQEQMKQMCEEEDWDEEDDNFDNELDENELDYETMKFLVRRQSDEYDVDHEFDILDEIDDNFSYFHDYKFKDPNIGELWKSVMEIFIAFDMLQIAKDVDVNEQDEEVRAIISHEDSIIHNYCLVQHLIEREFEESCFEYLHARIAEGNSTVNYDNFTIHGMPRGDGEVMMIIQKTVDHAAMDLVNSSREENSVSFEKPLTCYTQSKQIHKLV